MNRWMMVSGALVALASLTGCPADNNEPSDTGLGDVASGTDMGTSDADEPGELLYIAKLESTTTGDEGCAVGDPGPDIFGIGLEDGFGEALGWGRPVWEQLQLEGNNFGNTAILDGAALGLAPGECPADFDDTAVVSLGCEETGADAPSPRWLAFEFIDSDMARVALDAAADQFIRVYEWGGQCTNGTLADTYSLSICTDTEAITNGDDASCTITLLVDADGEQPGEVKGF